jgi:hypothetical protein
MEEPPTSRKSGPLTWLAPTAITLACLGLLAAAGTWLAREQSCTVDEPGHLCAGLSYWPKGGQMLSTYNLYFTQKWAAWPLYHAGLRTPGEAIRRRLKMNSTWIGEELLFTESADPLKILAPARMMTLVLCLLGGALVWAWASRVAGAWGGAFAALLYASSPVVLSLGALVTTDMGAALWYVAATACYGWMLRRPSAVTALLAGASAAMLALSKFTVLPWFLGSVVLLAWHLREPASRRLLPRLVGCHAAAIVVACVCIWAFFGFEFRPGGYVYLAGVPTTLAERALAQLAHWRVLPEPFLREYLSLEWLVDPRPGYLLGHYRMGGFWYYFPVAFVAKSTLGMLLALASWLALTRGPRQESCPPGMSPLVTSSLVYAAVAMFTPVNIGVRHILPIFFFAAIAGGVALARISLKGARWRAAAAAVALLAAAEGYSGWRQPLAWFNALWGGPMNGYRIMVEASLEWGGDLPHLAGWVKEIRASHTESPVYVCLLGPPDNECFGVPVADMVGAFEHGRVGPGYYVFSATRLEGGPWHLYGKWDDAMAREWTAKGAGTWRKPLSFDMAQLAVARLAASCRELVPTERVGPIYFVYFLDSFALDAALGKPQAP